MGKLAIQSCWYKFPSESEGVGTRRAHSVNSSLTLSPKAGGD